MRGMMCDGYQLCDDLRGMMCDGYQLRDDLRGMMCDGHTTVCRPAWHDV